MAGSIFENYVVAEIKKKLIHSHEPDQLYFYRTSNGEEIDLIIDRLQVKTFIEIKKTATFRPLMVRQIEKLIKNNNMGFLLYEGDKFPFKERLHIIPFSDYLME